MVITYAAYAEYIRRSSAGNSGLKMAGLRPDESLPLQPSRLVHDSSQPYFFAPAIGLRYQFLRGKKQESENVDR